MEFNQYVIEMGNATEITLGYSHIGNECYTTGGLPYEGK